MALSYKARRRWALVILLVGMPLYVIVAVNLVGLIPTLGGAALALLVPMGASAVLIAWAGRETRGRSLRELEA